MKHFLFDASIEDKAEELINFINNTEGQLKIFLDSNGGCLHSTRALIEVINDNKERIELSAQGYLFSCAFTLFTEVRCKRTVHKDVTAMCHLTGSSYRMSLNNEPFAELDKYRNNQNKSEIKRYLKSLEKIGMSKEDVEKVKDGKDVFFKYKDMKKFIKNN